MKIRKIKSRILWIVGTAISLIIFFFLCRYVIFSIHLNRDWPIFMLIIGLLALGIASIFDGRKIMAFTSAGYIVGCALGLLFGVEGIDPGGGAINNWWIIWTISFFAIFYIGLIWEIVGRILKNIENKYIP